MRSLATSPVILGLLVSQVGGLVSSLVLTDDGKSGNKPSHSGPPSLTGGCTSLKPGPTVTDDEKPGNKPSHSGPPSLPGGCTQYWSQA
jgi:hypothetical protein